MQSIIASLANRHSLSRTEVIQEIESAFSSLLSRWYRLEVMVFLQENMRLEAVAYSKSNGLTMQRVFDLPAFLSRNRLKNYLEEHLTMASAVKLVRYYKSFEKRLTWGEIIRCDSGQNFYVEIEIIPGEQIIAFCPLNRIGVHERYGGQLRIGQRRAFHLRRVEPVLLNGTPRVEVVLDRVSKTLVETVLRDQLGDEAKRFQFRCIKRYVGHKSLVLTTRRLPKAAILAVDRELKERVEVKIVKKLP